MAKGRVTTMMRWVQTGVGACVTILGIVASWRVLAPDGGLRSSSVRGWMFLGPALVTFGVLLLWTARAGGTEREARAPLVILQIGLAFLVPPAVAWIWLTIAGSQLAEFAWSLTAFTLGVPGAALAATGLILLWWRRGR